MKIIAQAFRPATLALVHRDLERRITQPKLWLEANTRAWSPGLNEGFTGSVWTCPTSLVVQGMIVNEMNSRVQLPRGTRWSAQYCRWGVDTGINPHSDERYLLAATLYLNEHWDESWGGLFMCKECVVPEYNLLIINDQAENHCVSRVKACAEYQRLTLQVWALAH